MVLPGPPGGRVRRRRLFMRSPVACIGGGAFLVLPYSLPTPDRFDSHDRRLSLIQIRAAAAITAITPKTASKHPHPTPVKKTATPTRVRTNAARPISPLSMSTDVLRRAGPRLRSRRGLAQIAQWCGQRSLACLAQTDRYGMSERHLLHPVPEARQPRFVHRLP